MNEQKYNVRTTADFKKFALTVASRMMQVNKVFVKADDQDLKDLFDKTADK